MVQNKIVKRKIKKYQITLKKVAKKVLAKKLKPAKIAKKSAKKVEIKSNMIIAEAIEKYPEAIKVFFEHGIACVGCFLASDETIEQGLSAHGIDVKKFIKDLNRAVQK